MCGSVFPNPISPFRGQKIVNYIRMETEIAGFPVFFVAKDFKGAL